jgi:hypothetical protein
MAEYQRFDAFHGSWSGRWRTWVEPDVLHDDSPLTGEVVPLLGGRDLLYRYTATIAGDPVEGTALIGPRQGGGCTIAWVDTWHTSGLVLVSHGDWVPGGLEVVTTYAAGDETWEWTSALTLTEGRLVVRHWNQGPGIPKYLGVEAILDPV